MEPINKTCDSFRVRDITGDTPRDNVYHTRAYIIAKDTPLYRNVSSLSDVVTWICLTFIPENQFNSNSMTTFVRIYFVLCVLVGCSYCQDGSDYVGARIDQKCERDRDCIKNAFCRVQMTCLCDPYYSPTPDKSMCTASVGLSCNDDSKCQTMANGECRQGLCACKDDFFLDSSNSSNCIRRPNYIGDLCQVNSVCQDSFNSSFCINEKCQCFTGFHFSNETKSCLPNRGLYNHCQKDSECYLDDKRPDVLECKNGECVCKEGERCGNKGSLMTTTGTLMTFILLLQQIV